jgi:hypothetical protein
MKYKIRTSDGQSLLLATFIFVMEITWNKSNRLKTGPDLTPSMPCALCQTVHLMTHEWLHSKYSNRIITTVKLDELFNVDLSYFSIVENNKRYNVRYTYLAIFVCSVPKLYKKSLRSKS